LFTYISGLKEHLSEAQSELRDKKDLLQLNRDRYDNAEKQIQLLNLEKVSHKPFERQVANN